MSAHLLIRDPGLATTLQDLGRRGFQRFGVPPSGALDRESLAEANALAGNPLDTPALELRYLGPVIEAAGGPLRLATAGTALAMRLARATGGEELIEGWQSVTLQPGDRLTVGALRQSATAYLAVLGGFDVALVLGAAATLTRASLGGFDGGLLQVGARLPLRAPTPEGPERALPPIAPNNDAPNQRAVPIRVVLGPQDDHFTPDAHACFVETDWQISDRSDRMGLRLAGPLLEHATEPGRGPDIVSDGITTGAIQVPGSGQPILLLADRQTSGGYAKIAAAISADLPLLGRLGPGATLRFHIVSAAEGAAAARRAAAALQTRLSQIAPLGESGLDLDALYSENLITAATEDDGPP